MKLSKNEIKNENKKQLEEVLNEIASEIKTVADAFQAVNHSKLKKEAVVVLLKARLPGVSKADIIAVIEEAAGLASSYLKK